jgi:hypothetical protein
MFSLTPKLPGPRPAQRPAGIGWGGITWIAGGATGLVLNALLLLLVCTLAPWFPQQAMSPDVLPWLGTAVVGTLAFYGGLIWVGSRVHAGKFPDVVIPAGLVLLLTCGVLICNTGTLVEMFPLVASWAEWATITNAPELFYRGGRLLIGAALTFVDVVLLASCVCLLWQSARYSHWIREGSHRPPISECRCLPRSLCLAGCAWVLAGFVAGWLVLSTRWPRLWLSPWTACTGGEFILAELASVPVLTLSLFGLLVLHGRLPSLLAPGVGVLLLGSVALLRQVALLGLCPAEFPADDTPVELLVRTLLAALASLAAFVCLLDNAAYKEWLRATRGLRV